MPKLGLVAIALSANLGWAFLPHPHGLGPKLFQRPSSKLPVVSTPSTEVSTPEKLPALPRDALIITSSDEKTWELEKKEYKTMAGCAERCDSFAPLLQSFKLKGKCYHAFSSQGTSLAEADFDAVFKRDDGRGMVGVAVADKIRMSLLRDLIEGVVYCHLQGAPHLALDSKTARLYKTEPPPGKRFGLWRLSLVGIGAGSQLVTRRSPYQVGNESWAFNPPETLNGALIKGNLPGLYAWDAWSVGTLVLMVSGGFDASPFEAEADVYDLTFSTQAAVAKKIKSRFGDMSSLLSQVNANGGGFLFRHGWVLELLVGLLKTDPSERMSVIEAREIMAGNRLATASPPSASSYNSLAAATGPPKKERQQQQAPPSSTKKSSSSDSGSASALTKEEMKILKDTFDLFDEDDSGDIDAEEIMAAMGNIGLTVTAAQAQRLIAENCGRNGGKTLSFVEFTLMSQDLVQATRAGDSDVGVLSASSVFGRRLSSTQGEPFRSLESMISIADKGLSEVVIQERLDGLKNYGEIVGFRNRADGDRWDVLVAGNQALPVGSRHRLSAVLGVVLIKGGNHKLVVSVGGFRPSLESVTADVDAFKESYSATHPSVRSGTRIRYMAFSEEPFERGAGELDVASLQLSASDIDGDGGNETTDDADDDEQGLGKDGQDGGAKKPPPTYISTAF